MEVSWLRRAPGITSSCLAILLGIPGNLLVVCVYRCKSTRTSTHVLICALAAADLLASLLIVFNPLFQRPQYLHEYSVVTKIHIALIDTLQLAGAFLLTGIAFDRYDAICRPHRRLLSIRRARALVGGCVGLWGVLTIITLVLVTPNSSPGDRRACSARLLVVISLPSTLWLCCFVTVVSLYAMVYKTVQKQGKVGASVVDQPRIPNAMTDEAKGDSDARHFGLTANSDAIPSSSLAGIWLNVMNCRGTPVPYGSAIVADVLMSFVMANNSANPFIYSLVNGNFRKSCLEILRKTRAKICRCFCRRVI
ncbi:olfactory receptor 4M1-like [Acanthaster planci]|uniref:Olfactory receptor 4M1-like n=1 Tax=Acanthaster planci TaxID=133434 RepID=A0A8B7ZJM7_ACAPL|nr:olfactory receptor 4M1-like [Acanthaster planci]